MTGITLSSTSYGYGAAGQEVNKLATIAKKTTETLSTGKDIQREEIATAAVAKLNKGSTEQYVSNTQRAQNILSQAISDLGAVLEQLQAAQQLRHKLLHKQKQLMRLRFLQQHSHSL